MRAIAGVVCLLAAVGTSLANNLSISNVNLIVVAAGQADIEFKVRWDNSWRTSWRDNGDTVAVTNWDAVWLFAKYRQSGGTWKPVLLAPEGHSAPEGAVLAASTNCGAPLGAFLYRADEGAGSVSYDSVKLRWDYVAGGLQGTNEVDIAVFGTEMVYIPEGPFALGSGGGENGHFYTYPDTNSVYWVQSEDAIDVGAVTGRLCYAASGVYGDRQGPIPAGHPKGYRSFYCMKHEITQGQYTDYLNTLDSLAGPRFADESGNYYRYAITKTGTVYYASAPDRSCNYLSWSDLRDYFDWSGLRPMTELEFEKICRGVRAPLPNEYVWGTSAWLGHLTGIVGADGSGSEVAGPSSANVHVSAVVQGPVRAGIFATAASGREAAGAGYYGVLDLAGNLFELTITSGFADGRALCDVYGDGSLLTPTPAEWKASSSALGLRGGSFVSGASAGAAETRTSDRSKSTYSTAYDRNQSCGGRGVRKAP